ncbi:DUF2254 domain-containing protein [Thalassobacillus sp. CUG 92003]|uniref:DUF2254 domain-containing protein n=1 Tax=Thalassobacillus sp. CUG 92003 TaxID=2736641 RepID=UPI002102DAA6|nr:DUF2254 domain-containing protein [Thalassobacillus sp. CUG 92003]
MSKRMRQHEVQLTLWRMPLRYVGSAILLLIITLILDIQLEIWQYSPDPLIIGSDMTRTLVSTLVGAILTLSAFTLNSILVVLTTFSGQFSPRMLLNFVSDNRTQHALGIFNGSFVYVLLVFLFTGNSEEIYVSIPIVTVLLAFLSAMAFIYFINHATSWMQVHNITFNMKTVSKNIIRDSLRNDLEAYRTKEPKNLMEPYREIKKTVRSEVSGYFQVVDFRQMIQEARKDQIILRFHSRVGDFILEKNRLFSYWGPGAEYIDEDKYHRMIELGHKETEIQDIQMGMHKLAEIAIKSLGNDDPKTATNTIHQMAELMLSVDEYITFTPYLMDDNQQVRVVLEEEDFDYYLYRGFGFIRHYSQKNYPIITEIIGALALIAESIDPSKHESIWKFAKNTVDHIEGQFVYDLDRVHLLNRLFELATITDAEPDYYLIEERMFEAAK